VSKEEEEAHEVPGVDSAEAVAEVDEDEPHAARREDELPVGLERGMGTEVDAAAVDQIRLQISKAPLLLA